MAFQGLIAAPPTPMTRDGELDLRVVPQQIESLLRDGVSGAFVCGSTGESMSLTMAERLAVAEAWIREAPLELPVIVHVGHTSLGDVRRLAAHAQAQGAAAIAAMPPFFFKPPRLEELIAFCAQAASAAPELPFYYYHIPVMTGVTLSIAEFLTRGRDVIPTLAGAKFTHEDLMDFGLCLGLDKGAFNLLFGRDEILLSALALGATGAVGSTYNFAAPLYRRLMEAFAGGDLESARECQRKAVAAIQLLKRYGGLPAFKAVMAMIGVDCGPVRLPLAALSPDDVNGLRRGLEEMGFFDWGR